MAIIPKRYSAAFAGATGNMLEWFDFAIYGYFATALGKVFFPASDPTLQTVASFGIFAIGYLARPIGSLILGPVGDLLGRRKMMIWSIMIMGVASFMVALLPSYAQVGAIAAYALLFLRMTQGFSIGGEYTGSMVYAAEASPQGKEGLMSGIAHAGALLGFFLGSLIAALTAFVFGESAVNDWAWRLPFLLGALVAIAGWKLRAHMPETLETAIQHKLSFKELFALIALRLKEVAQGWKVLVQIAALISFSNVLFYVQFVYFVDYAAKHGGSMQSANTVATAIQFVGIPLVVLGGWLADKIGRIKITWYATWAGAILCIPAILASQFGGVVGLAIGQSLIVAPVMLLFGAQGILISRLVKPEQRCSVFAIGYSLAVALFAGTAPMVTAWLLEINAWTWGPAAYCFIYAIPAIYALHSLRNENQ
ncbi:MFS transporter [Polynucleobacter sp. MWH-CaK5]|uniref:MFS transporter n=1 Tax=Polynucleobacter sp. MWH-CaK5 TaxID=2689107 RepID=UPI001BFE1512|nr:MFS transporter [Polynucleobacter sp. MWH-CaK5]QWD89468.1 MFS transporter [Polynucleobacter sp. MWH-CaK5]